MGSCSVFFHLLQKTIFSLLSTEAILLRVNPARAVAEDIFFLIHFFLAQISFSSCVLSLRSF